MTALSTARDVPPAPDGGSETTGGMMLEEELQVRAAEASAAAQAAELLGDDLVASIAASDLADLRALAARNDIELEEVVLGESPSV